MITVVNFIVGRKVAQSMETDSFFHCNGSGVFSLLPLALGGGTGKGGNNGRKKKGQYFSSF